MDAQYLIDRPRRGADNMAIDQRMLELAVQHRCIFLRLYQWSVPTVSLGYFQNHADRVTHGPSQDLAWVRRATGGGAIVHHFDWTYAIAIPETVVADAIGSHQEVYDLVHDQVIAMLGRLGVPAGRWREDRDARSVAAGPACESTVRGTPEDERDEAAPAGVLDQTSGTDRPCRPPCPFLCFLRRSPGDIVSGPWKLMGSAQRRDRGGLLQHGSLLLRGSPHAPELVGVWDLLRSSAPPTRSGPIAAPRAEHSRAAAEWSPWEKSIGPALVQAICEGTERQMSIAWRPMVSPIPCPRSLVNKFESDTWNRKR